MEQEGEVEASNINISDVIEVIETDPEFGSEMMDRSRRVTEGPAPSVRIIEQPASKALRFRYECEGRSAGSIPGVNSTPENKTFPTIKIDNYHGRAMVLVSCVTKDPPYRAHPHNLVGKERCKKGVCTVEVDSDTMTATFSNLGIQCVKKKDIEQALIERENLRIDPFKNGFSHKTQSGMIDLNAVRLCFQVFLEGPRPNEFKRPIHPPIVSEPIYDKKAMSDLTICKLSDCSASVAGGKEIILLCEKVAKEDINVRFYEEKDGNIVWEGWGDFTPTHVHKQVAIAFRSPRYKTLEVEYPVQAFIQLFRPSDKATSEPLHFQLTPLDADPVSIKRKKQRISSNTSQDLLRHMADAENFLRLQKNSGQPDISQIKLEPSFAGKLSPIHHSPMSSPPYGGPSGYQPPSVYQPPTPTVIQGCYTSPMHEMPYVPQPAFSPSSPLQPVQQVDVQMAQMEMGPILHQLQPNRISPQNVLQPLNDLNAPQIGGMSLQNVLQRTNDLNSPVQMNQLPQQPQNLIPSQQPTLRQENDELNTPTVSATGIEDQNNAHGNAFGEDNQRMTQLTSGDIACILGGMETGSLSQNLSNLSFE